MRITPYFAANTPWSGKAHAQSQWGSMSHTQSDAAMNFDLDLIWVCFEVTFLARCIDSLLLAWNYALTQLPSFFSFTVL